MCQLEWSMIDRYGECYRDTTGRFTVNKVRVTYELFDNKKLNVLGYYKDLQNAKEAANEVFTLTNK